MCESSTDFLSFSYAQLSKIIRWSERLRRNPEYLWPHNSTEARRRFFFAKTSDSSIALALLRPLRSSRAMAGFSPESREGQLEKYFSYFIFKQGHVSQRIYISSAGSLRQATDSSFLEKCHFNHRENPLYAKPKMSNPEFAIKHYAGEMERERERERELN